jgi:hypothetical protein
MFTFGDVMVLKDILIQEGRKWDGRNTQRKDSWVYITDEYRNWCEYSDGNLEVCLFDRDLSADEISEVIISDVQEDSFRSGWISSCHRNLQDESPMISAMNWFRRDISHHYRPALTERSQPSHERRFSTWWPGFSQKYIYTVEKLLWLAKCLSDQISLQMAEGPKVRGCQIRALKRIRDMEDVILGEKLFGYPWKVDSAAIKMAVQSKSMDCLPYVKILCNNSVKTFCTRWWELNRFCVVIKSTMSKLSIPHTIVSMSLVLTISYFTFCSTLSRDIYHLVEWWNSSVNELLSPLIKLRKFTHFNLSSIWSSSLHFSIQVSRDFYVNLWGIHHK